MEASCYCPHATKSWGVVELFTHVHSVKWQCILLIPGALFILVTCCHAEAELTSQSNKISL